MNQVMGNKMQCDSHLGDNRAAKPPVLRTRVDTTLVFGAFYEARDKQQVDVVMRPSGC